MGHESRLYVCEVTAAEPGVDYVSPIAMLDVSELGTRGPFAQLLRRYPAPPTPRFYLYDGDTPVKVDGENLRPLPLDEVVEAIQAEVHDSERAGQRPYGTYAVLAALELNRAEWRDRVVLVAS